MTNINNEEILKPDQEIKKRQIQKQSENEIIQNNKNNEENAEEEGEEEEDTEYEYEYEYGLSPALWVILIGTLILFIGFIVFINLNYPLSKQLKELSINSLVDFKNQFFMKKVYVSALVTFFVFQLTNSLIILIIKHIQPNANNSTNNDLNDLTATSLISSFIIAGFCLPIGEELVFRKLLFGIINLFSKPLAYLISSFIFAFFHFQFSFKMLKEEYLRFPIYLIDGLILAYVYDFTGCILSTFIAHCLNNIYTVVLSYYGILN